MRAPYGPWYRPFRSVSPALSQEDDRISTLAALHTAVGGGAVAVTTGDGAMAPDAITGLYLADRRLLSLLRIDVPGHTTDLLASAGLGPSHHVTHRLVTDHDGRQVAMLSDDRRVDGGLEIALTIRALSGEVTIAVTIDVATDLGDLLTLRYGQPPPAPLPYRHDGGRLLAGDDALGVTVSAADAVLDAAGRLTWTVTVAPGAPRTVTCAVRPRPDRHRRAPVGGDLQVTGDHRWSRAVASAHADLAALHMRDDDHGLSWIGAGAPWYLALFGRDALLTAHEALPVGTTGALDVLDALAAFQGTASDPRTGEAPGKVLHELRTGHSGVFGLAPWQPYYGSVDATPLFVVLLADAWRWGADGHRVRALLPAARRAVAWCRQVAAADPLGHLTYDADATGLVNQGWKDSATAMVHADGTVAPPPIAVVEAQGYHWRALRDLAALERHLGDADAAQRLADEADALRDRVLAAFRTDGGCRIAMARDGDGRRLEVASSNAGHLLWVGMLDPDDATALANRLTAPDMAAGWGVRTLSSDAAAYDPLSYHCGSIWPHDTALVVDGIARAGGTRTAADLIDGLLRVAEHTGWRLPELFAGYGDDEVAAPVPYPTTCSPQAWSAAAPLALLRTLLRLDPDVPYGTVTIGPALRDDLTLRVSGIRLGEHRLDITVDRGRLTASTDASLDIVIRR